MKCGGLIKYGGLSGRNGGAIDIGFMPSLDT
jgi:hypothetical protein